MGVTSKGGIYVCKGPFKGGIWGCIYTYIYIYYIWVFKAFEFRALSRVDIGAYGGF